MFTDLKVEHEMRIDGNRIYIQSHVCQDFILYIMWHVLSKTTRAASTAVHSVLFQIKFQN